VILQNGSAAFIDRLGSDRRNTRYYPYGEEYTATANDREKFASYFRDSSTGLDYAMNRYYGSNLGRFLTPDPFGGSAKPTDPQTWNRYAYVGNDPGNRTDPSGLVGECFWSGEGIVCPPMLTGDFTVYGYAWIFAAIEAYYAANAPSQAAGMPQGDAVAVKKFSDEAGEFLKSTPSSDCTALLNKFLQPFDFTMNHLKTKMGDMLKHVADGTASIETLRGSKVKELFELTNPDGEWAYNALASQDERNGVWIRPDTVRANSVARNQALGIHETIHNLTNQNDAWMKTQLGIESSGSEAITTEIQKACFPGTGDK
jgi:RHS repeat-associated protein